MTHTREVKVQNLRVNWTEPSMKTNSQVWAQFTNTHHTICTQYAIPLLPYTHTIVTSLTIYTHIARYHSHTCTHLECMPWPWVWGCSVGPLLSPPLLVTLVTTYNPSDTRSMHHSILGLHCCILIGRGEGEAGELLTSTSFCLQSEQILHLVATGFQWAADESHERGKNSRNGL